MNSAIQQYLASNPISTVGSLIKATGARECVYEAIANEDVFFDLERDFIQDEKAPVYRERIHWEADRALRAKPPVSVCVSGTLDTSIGGRVLYDGRESIVVSASNDALWIKTGGSSLVELSRSSLPSLISANRLAVSTSERPRDSVATALIAKASPAKIKRALARFAAIKPWVLGERCDGITDRTLRRFAENYRIAEARIGYGLAGLLDHVEGRGNCEVKLLPSVIVEIQKIVQQDLLTPHAPNIATAHRLLNYTLRAKGLPTVSRKSFNRRAEEVDREKWAYARYGHKVANAERPPHPVNDLPVHGDRAWEVGHIDSEMVDAEIISERTGASLEKGWLTVLFNANPSFPLGWHYSLHKPNQDSVLMAVRDCVRRYNRLPDLIVYDLGPEHQGTTFDVLKATYKTDFIRRPRGNPRYGGVLESFWNSINQYFLHQVKGSTH